MGSDVTTWQSVRQDIKTIGATPVLWPMTFLVFISAFVSFISVRALGSMVPICLVLSLGLYVFQTRSFPKPSPMLSFTWILFVALIAIAALRSMDVDYASGRLIKLATLTLVAVLFWSLSGRLVALRALQPLLIVAFLIGLVLCLFEGISDGTIFWLTHNVSQGEAAHAINRPVVLLVLFLWPVGLAIAQSVGQRAVWLVVLLSLVASFTTESQSAQLAGLVGTAVLVSSLVLPRFTLWAVGVGGVVAILALPFVFAGFDLMPSEESAIFSKQTVLPRIELWTFVAHKIMAQPLLGYGLEVGRFLPLDDMTQKYFGGTRLHHPHNGILQVWFEMGLLGASFLALGWGLLVRRVGDLTGLSQSYVLSGLACILVVSTVSHGLWQTWWVSALVVVPFFYGISMAAPLSASDKA